MTSPIQLTCAETRFKVVSTDSKIYRLGLTSHHNHRRNRAKHCLGAFFCVLQFGRARRATLGWAVSCDAVMSNLRCPLTLIDIAARALKTQEHCA